MSERFYAPEPPAHDYLILSGDQAHHALNVMRMKTGESLCLFDGKGKEYTCNIIETRKKELTVQIVETKNFPRVLDREITIGVAIPKGDRQKFLIEKLVELGVTRLVPIKTNRSVAVANEKAVQRMKKSVIEASKQCRRNWLMEISDATPLESFAGIANWQNKEDTLFVMADPYCQTPLVELASTKSRIVAVVGPEGGFDESEARMLAEQGWQPAWLGPTILRIETAAIAIASIAGVGMAVPKSE